CILTIGSTPTVCAMITPEIQATTTAAAVPAVPSAATAPSAPTTPSVPEHTTAAGNPFTFHELLSAMNPLQYLPVVGTIYRAVTGDVIPEMVRQAGSMLVSGLLGGPIGLGINVATTLAEKATGVDPEKIATAMLNPSPASGAATVAPAAPVE